MRTRTFESAPIISIRCLAAPLLLALAGCFTAPSPDLGRLKCTTDQQCPAGYSCLASNQVGGCCKPGTPCPVTAAMDALNPDFSPADLRTNSEAQPMGVDLGTGGTGGLIAPDGAAAGGAGGAPQLDASVSDSPEEMPASDVAIEGATMDVPADTPMDAPGTCSFDKDCPAQSPLCLANKCAKCTTDTDCVGRTGPACQTTSGLCVGCTANKHCAGAAATCNTTTNQCTGCITRSDCSGACLTCASGVCTSVKNQDDPGVCAGTCDATGACKAKNGQTCQATTDCAGGLPCADGYCCDSTCTGSCQACNVTTSPGTCTTLAANAAPHPGHPACAGTDVCAGKCSGTSPDCTFPTASTTCGTASCSSATVYQGAGTCNAGTCSLPSAKTCPNGCVVSSGGCTDCKPTTTGCSSTGVPQLCDATGTWQNQTACLTGYTCASGSCTCATGKTACPTACTDVQSDSKNCGSCGHDCLGGACSAGSCQPTAITGTLTYSPTMFGIDSQYAYYGIASSAGLQAQDAYRVGKGATGAAGSLLYTPTASFVHYLGVIGQTILIDDGMKGYYSYTLGASAWLHLPNSQNGNTLALFRASPPSYFAQRPSSLPSNAIGFNWYDVNDNMVASFSESVTDFTSADGTLYDRGLDPAAYDNKVYWLQTVLDSSSNTLDTSGLYAATTASTSARQQLAGGSSILNMQIIDANALSVLLLDATAGWIERVPVAGYGKNSPLGLVAVSTYNATEDANGVYWMDSLGSLYRCAPANCTYTVITLASNQGTISGFYQDDKALYWGRSSPNAIMRLAK